MQEQVKKNAGLGIGSTRDNSSAVLSNLAGANHAIDVNKAFKVISNVPITYPKGMRQHCFANHKVITIELSNPQLCIKRQCVVGLELYWPMLGQSISSNYQIVMSQQKDPVTTNNLRPAEMYDRTAKLLSRLLCHSGEIEEATPSQRFNSASYFSRL